MTVPSARFLRAVRANLDYWLAHTQDLADEVIVQLLPELANLFQAVTFGLARPETQQVAACLTGQLFPLIERSGNWETWIPLMGRCAGVCRRVDDSLAVRLLNHQGQLLRFRGRLSSALAAHQEAGALAIQAEQPYLVGEVLFNLCTIHLYTRRLEEAEQMGQQALAIFASDESQWQAATLNSLGRVAQAQGDFDRAGDRFQAAVNLWRRLDDPTELARSLNNLGLNYQRCRCYLEAIACYQEALQHLAPTGSEMEKSKVRNNLGIVHFEQGDYSQAEMAFRQANSRALRQSGDTATRASLAQNIGNVILLQGFPEEAEAHLLRAEALWLQANDKLNLANTLGTLAEMKIALGEQAAARALYNRALVLITESQHHHWAKKMQHQFTAAMADFDEPVNGTEQ